MYGTRRARHGAGAIFAAFITGIVLAVSTSASANAATTINGPINLGAATPFAVLGGTTVTNTGSSTVNGDLGVSPGSAISGFPPGVLNGTPHPTDSVAAQGEADLTTAFTVAASLTPTTSGLHDLVGLTLSPGVYSGNALSLSGNVTLDAGGNPSAVWVFQAASTLVTGSGSSVNLTGGANACNVFWQVGSSATLGSGSHFTGSILAGIAITANSTAQVTGRLLTRVAAVTMDTNTVTVPSGCADASGSTVSSSPTFTSASSKRVTVGTSIGVQFTASGSSPSVYTVTGGVLPDGTNLNPTTGVLSGRVTRPGTYSWTVTASNGVAPAASQNFTLVVTPLLAQTGVDPGPSFIAAIGLVVLGLALRSRRLVARWATGG